MYITLLLENQGALCISHCFLRGVRPLPDTNVTKAESAVLMFLLRHDCFNCLDFALIYAFDLLDILP